MIKKITHLASSIILAMLPLLSMAQSTTINTTVGSTGYTGSNSSGTNGYITFVVTNNNTYNIKVTAVGSYSATSHNGSNTALWYTNTALSGAVTLATPTWNIAASNVVSGITSTGVNTLISNMNFVIPSGATYRLAVASDLGTNYYSGTGVGTCTPNTFNAGGVTLYTGDYQIAGSYIGYGASNNPRFFTGFITFEPACSTAVTTQPVPATICAGTQTSFTINAIDNDTYQWQVDEGTGFANLSNGPVYSNVTTKTLNVNNVGFNMNGNLYRCLAIKNTGCVAKSDSVKLTVRDTVDVTPLAMSDTTCVGGSTSFDVTAKGDIAGYQWQIDEVGGGFTNVGIVPPFSPSGNKLQLSNIPANFDGRKFRAIVTGTCESDTSTELVLKVNAVPQIATSPSSISTQQGNTVTFTATATSAYTRYQWQAGYMGSFVNINDNGNYSGTRTNVLTVHNVALAQDGYQFRCQVLSNTCVAPGDTSDVATLTVEPALSVNSITGNNGISVFPNPASGTELFIKGITSAQATYTMFDKLGRVVLSGNLDNATTKINISSLPADVYIVEITNGQDVINKTKFTKL